MRVDRVFSKGQLVAVQFMQDDVAASQTNVQLGIIQEDDAASNQSIAGVIMPFDGEIVAISYLLSAAGSAGTLTIGPTIGGTEDANLTQTVTTATSGYAKVPRTTIPVSAGDEIGVEITTDASWNGTSSDLAVWVWVRQDIEGI